MSMRFGGYAPEQSSISQKHFLLVLIGVTSLLLVYLLIKVFSPEPVVVSNIVTEPEEELAAPSTVDVVTARVQIAPGQRIEENMIEPKPMSIDSVPGYAVAWEDRYTDAVGKWTRDIINPDTIFAAQDLSQRMPYGGKLPIPRGYRAISIAVSSEIAVDGYVVPGSRVDVHWKFVDGGRKYLQTLAQYVSVVAVDGDRDEKVRNRISGKANVTLAVSAETARRIELARGNGELSLVLNNDQDGPVGYPYATSPLDLPTIQNTAPKPSVPGLEEEIKAGTACSLDDNGVRQCYELTTRGGWKPAS